MNINQLVNEIEQAETRIRPYIRETALEYSPYLSKQSGAEIWLKCEQTQHTGSFKVRGALNALLALSDEQRKKGVIAASSGNHGAAVAFGLRTLGIPGIVVVPEDAAPTKIAAIRSYGAEVILHGDDCLISEGYARQLAEQRGMHYISPYNDLQVVAGQGTLGVEIARQIDKLDALYIAVGGGGLASGVFGYLKSRWPTLEAIGCQPAQSAVMAKSIEAGSILELPDLPTLSDGTAGGIEADSITFPFCQELIDRFELVPEAAIAAAIRLLIETHHTLIEGAAGVAVAALLQSAQHIAGKRVGVVLCGANLSVATLQRVLAAQ